MKNYHFRILNIFFMMTLSCATLNATLIHNDVSPITRRVIKNYIDFLRSNTKVLSKSTKLVNRKDENMTLYSLIFFFFFSFSFVKSKFRIELNLSLTARRRVGSVLCFSRSFMQTQIHNRYFHVYMYR